MSAPLQRMRTVFRTLKFGKDDAAEMVFRFRSADDLWAAEEEWIAWRESTCEHAWHGDYDIARCKKCAARFDPHKHTDLVWP